MASFIQRRLASCLFIVILFPSPPILPLQAMVLALALPQPKPSDTDALTIFRARADAHGNLAANWSGPDACTGRWHGVGCSGGRVTSLSLPSLDLRGSLDPLSHLDQLRLLDLHANRLNGTLIPLLPALPNLKLLYLSRNDLSGSIPPAVSLLRRLLRLDLSGNSLSGSIPGGALSSLTRLLTLRLQDNLLSGPLPDLSAALPRLAEFNASNNELSGRVPDGMRTRFGVTSFTGNAALCGPTPPLPLCSFPPQGSPRSPQTTVVPSNPSSVPKNSSSVDAMVGGPVEKAGRGSKGGLSTGAIAGITAGNALFLLAVASSILVSCSRRRLDGQREEEKDEGRRSSGDSCWVEERKKGRQSGGGGGESDEGEAQHKLVFFEQDDDDGRSHSSGGSCGGRGSRKGRRQRREFGLEELLRASAEMVGKGSLGTVYRAVLEDGCMVAVKRLRDSNPCPSRDFARYMQLIGCLHHPNLVPLRAYYYARQEKLLIYDYLPNGTLYDALHSNRGAGRVPLDWTTRVSLVLGAARGLAFIHHHYSSSRIPHGNINAANVLLDKNGVARISDFGLALLLSPADATARLGGYRAPEQADSRTLSQEADVYAFGVVVLEVLTGKAPSPCPATTAATKGGAGGGINLPQWVQSVLREEWTAEVFDAELMRYKNVEEEMVAMLHVGLACAGHEAERRPTMPEVVKMIEDIRVEQSPLAEEDLDESRTSLSPSLATTDDARLN